MKLMEVQTWRVVAVLAMSISMLAGCKPRNEPVDNKQVSVQEQKIDSIPLIQSKTIDMEVLKSESCMAEGCTQYNLQTVDTNVDWINQYFDARIKKAEPTAFSAEPNEKVNVGDDSTAGLSQSSLSVRYISQWYKVATFIVNSYTYSAGAAHGLYHKEYVNFDLGKEQRISLQDVLVKGAEKKVVDELYNANASWLNDHSILREKLQLSDNFYYGAEGIVFVYPLYELASYAEGMTELVLPYRVTQTLIKPEYLPSLPHYKKTN